jgi:biotin transport system substrate-specific component
MFVAAGVALFALATAAGAQVRIPLPGTPVPVTLQVLFVLLSGMILGARAGAASQILCLGAGIAGIPAFSGSGFGLAWLCGPTGGYLMAFPAAAFLAGLVSGRRSLPALAAGSLAGILTIYAGGMAWLAFSLHMSPAGAVAAGVLPFIAFDAAKAAVAVAVARTARWNN